MTNPMHKKAISVVKRDGSKEPFALEKIQRQLAVACDGVAGVSPSMVEMGMQLEIHDGITTKHLDQIAINSAVHLITRPEEEGGNTNYQYVAGRLVNNVLRKDVYGQYDPPKLIEIVKRGVKLNLYTPALLEWYTEEEWDLMDTFVDHSKDEKLSHAAISQMIDKYLVRNRSTQEYIETPQVRYIIAAATAMHAEKTRRMRLVNEYYKSASNGDFTLPSPVLAGLGTPTKQFSSCVVVRANDSMDSIFATGEMLARYAAKRAGIGLDFSRIRATGSAIRSGEIKHTGPISFLKKWQHDLKSIFQGGTRAASMSCWTNILHKDIEDIIVLKNNKGTEETRVRQLDYGIVTSAYLWNRFVNKQPITLFDPNEAEDLYNLFYTDQAAFIEAYEKAENDPAFMKKAKVVDSGELFRALLRERNDTGRIYLMFIDGVIDHAPIDVKRDPIYQSNLCAEILLPSQSFERIEDVGTVTLKFDDVELELPGDSVAVLEDGSERLVRTLSTGDKVQCITRADGVQFDSNDGASEVEIIDAHSPTISLCTLGSMNWGRFRKPEDMRKACRMLVRSLNNLLEYQDFLSPQSDMANQDYRPLGIGLTNLAYWHAKRNMKYGDPEALAEVKRWIEHQTYYITEASIELAEERGACAKVDWTRYKQGIFPWELRADGVNELTDFTPSPELDWEGLRERAKRHGIRNAFLGATAPVESCQSTDNLLLQDGVPTTLRSILVAGGIDVQAVEDNGSQMWIKLPRAQMIDGANGPELVEHVWYNGAAPVYEIEFATGGKYKFTSAHRLMCAEGTSEKFKYIRNIEVGTYIKNAFSQPTKIVKKTQLGVEHTWDVSTPTETFLLSNGCISHNSSVVLDSTNGMELPMALITTKESKGGSLVHVVPDYHKLKDKYQLMWDQSDCIDYIKTAAVISAYQDQSASTNTFYNPAKYPDGKVPITLAAKNILLAQKWGIRTLYYNLTNKRGVKKQLEEQEQELESIEIEEFDENEEACGGCTL